jgi:hypothetical protein
MRRSGDESQPLLLRIDRARDAACLFDVERLLAARLARAQHVEADARDHGGQPAAEVLHVAGLGAAHFQPRFLHGVLRFARRPEHAQGHGSQVRAVLLEASGQPALFVHAHPL